MLGSRIVQPSIKFYLCILQLVNCLLNLESLSFYIQLNLKIAKFSCLLQLNNYRMIENQEISLSMNYRKLNPSVCKQVIYPKCNEVSERSSSSCGLRLLSGFELATANLLSKGLNSRKADFGRDPRLSSSIYVHLETKETINQS